MRAAIVHLDHSFIVRASKVQNTWTVLRPGASRSYLQVSHYRCRQRFRLKPDARMKRERSGYRTPLYLSTLLKFCTMGAVWRNECIASFGEFRLSAATGTGLTYETFLKWGFGQLPLRVLACLAPATLTATLSCRSGELSPARAAI